MYSGLADSEASWWQAQRGLAKAPPAGSGRERVVSVAAPDSLARPAMLS